MTSRGCVAAMSRRASAWSAYPPPARRAIAPWCRPLPPLPEGVLEHDPVVPQRDALGTQAGDLRHVRPRAPIDDPGFAQVVAKILAGGFATRSRRRFGGHLLAQQYLRQDVAWPSRREGGLERF